MNVDNLRKMYDKKRAELLNFNMPDEDSLKKTLDDYLFYLNMICGIERRVVYQLDDLLGAFENINKISFKEIKTKIGKEESINVFYWILKYYADDRLDLTGLLDTSVEDGISLIGGGIELFINLFEPDASANDAFNIMGRMDKNFTINSINKLKSLVICDFVELAALNINRYFELHMLEEGQED